MEEIGVDFYSDANETLLNPRLPPDTLSQLTTLSDQFSAIKGHFWLTTSGTTSNPKLVALSKKAVFESAASVNRVLQASAEDVWLLTLPLFHIGGLSILARSEEAGSSYVSVPSWSPKIFVELCSHHKATLASLVPTQLFDLLSLDIEAPDSLRAVIVGGGKLSPRLFAKARELKWPILPSFGSTEACSQIATALIKSLTANEFPKLHLLPHLHATTSPEGRLIIEGASLFSGYASYKNGEAVFNDPKTDGSFLTEDYVSLEETTDGISITPQGRMNDTIKISGELISVSEVNEQLDDILVSDDTPFQAVVISVSDTRLENRLALVGSLPQEKLLALRDRLAQRVLPVARPKEIYWISKMPLSDMGKPLLNTIYAGVKDGSVKKIYPGI